MLISALIAPNYVAIYVWEGGLQNKDLNVLTAVLHYI